MSISLNIFLLFVTLLGHGQVENITPFRYIVALVRGEKYNIQERSLIRNEF